MKGIYRFPIAFFAFGFWLCGFSQSTILSDTLTYQNLDEVEVTATRTSTLSAKAPRLVSVIDKRQINSSSATSVEELISAFSSVDVIQRGGHGVQSDISIKGGSFDQVAVLLNGINISNPQTGHYSMDIPVNLSDIERIEIIEGASAMTFGVGAFSGGINIITKKNPHDKLHLSLQGGSHGMFRYEGRGVLKGEKSLSSLSSSLSRSDGYIKGSDYNLANFFFQNSLTTHGASIDLQAGLNKKKYGANTFYSPSFPNQYDDTKSVFLSVKGNAFVGSLNLRPALFWTRHYDVFHLFREGSLNIPPWYKAPNYHQSDVFGANLNASIERNEVKTSFGSEMRHESILSSVLGNAMTKNIGNYTKSYNRTNISYFLEKSANIDGILSLSLGLMLNYNSAIENFYKVLPSANLMVVLSEKFNTYASYNKGMRMPTFTDLYYNTKTHQGDAGLRPEYTDNFEIGLKKRGSVFSADMNLFFNRGKNLIDWSFATTDNKWHSTNLERDGHLDTYGGKVALRVDMSEALHQDFFKSFRLQYQHLERKDSNQSQNNPISMYVYNYLRDKLTIGGDFQIVQNLSFHPSLRFNNRAGQYSKYISASVFEKVDYGTYTLVDAKLIYGIGKWSFFVNANNLSDKQYFDLGNIPQPGLWLSGGASIKI